MKKIRFLSLIAACLICASVSARAEVSTGEFTQKAAVGNRFEIDSSKLAKSRASSGKVRDFANRMIKDHTKAGKDLKAALKTSNMPAPDDTPDADHQALLDGLKTANGKDFDKRY